MAHPTITITVPFRYGKILRPLLSVLGMGPRWSRIEIDDETVRVRMGWAFRATFPRSSITAITLPSGRVLSRGAHGFLGRWLVNGAGDRLVTIAIEPRVRAYVSGWPIRLRELTLSVDDPDSFAATLRPR